MRNAFALEITALAAMDPRVVLLSGDIGNRLFDLLKSLCPHQFHNCGVAEANMMGVAAGLALSGMRPVAYTITPFLTTRCLEQIKLDVCCHNLPVTLVGVGSGLSYSSLGSTHHSLEDLAILRTLPNMTVVCPADAVEGRLALRAAMQQDGPVYIRLGKKGEPILHRQAPDFRFGRAVVYREGTDTCLIGTGPVVRNCLEAADILAASGVSAMVAGMHTVKPLDTELLGLAFSTCRVVATVEEHWLAGGFGSAVAEWYVDNRPGNAVLRRFGVADAFLHACGSHSNAQAMSGLSAKALAEGVLAELNRA